jgi:hypothetical protein
MRFIAYTLFLLLFSLPVLGQCPSGQSEIQVNIVPDGFPSEISWSLRNASTNALIDTGGYIGDTVCVPSGQCVRFNLYDSFGDGILGSGYYQVKLNGTIIAQGGQNYDHYIFHYLNCPPGTSCADPLTIITTGSYVAPAADTWYRFVADTTGNFRFSTCGLSNCDTRIYGYDQCVGIQFDDAVFGVSFYNDNFCGLQSEVNYGMAAGDVVFVRIGDAGTACANQPIAWQVSFTGPVTGCMDPAACNYNPVATLPDTNCVYSGPLCQGPDLAPDLNYLISSLAINNNHVAQTCEVQEGCIQGYGNRKLLYYGVQIWNYGTQPYWPGTYISNPNGYEWAPCHGHWHYKGFANSYLYDEQLNQVDFARKTSYAIINMTCQSPTSDPALAAGCSDIYGAGYACQWVDVTDLAPGLYHLVLKINPDGLPDQAGREETNLANNGVQVCIRLTQDIQGNKAFTIEPNCPVFTDCLGIPFGNTPTDCDGNCNGVRIRGDLNMDTLLTPTDVSLYLNGITAENIPLSLCNDLTGDSAYTVYDAARLNGCLKSTDSSHVHLGGYSGNHGHCNFPFHIDNPFDTITLGLSNLTDSTVDIMVKNPHCFLLATEFRLHGLLIDSVRSVSPLFNPTIVSNPQGHVTMLSRDELSLTKLYVPTAVFRAYYTQRTDSIICVEEIIDVVNSNYEKVIGLMGSCVMPEPVISAVSSVKNLSLDIYPNPSRSQFQVLLNGELTRQSRYRITDQLGRTVANETVEEGRPSFTIQAEKWQPGLYHLTVEAADARGFARLVLIR